jgi:hypothetical protein
MIQAFSHIFNFFNIASPCGDMTQISILKRFLFSFKKKFNFSSIPLIFLFLFSHQYLSQVSKFSYE